MSTLRLATVVTVLVTLWVASVSASQVLNATNEVSHERKDKKADQMVNDMYTAFMMTKNVMSMMVMFVSPIIQIKGFGLSVINTIVNIGRLMLQMQANKRLQDMAQVQHVGSMYPQRTYAMRHIDQNMEQLTDPHKEQHIASEDKRNNEGNSPVYIFKDSDSWSSGSPGDSWSIGEHEVKVDEEISFPWGAKGNSGSAYSSEPLWPPSQKFEYNASPPGLPYSSRRGSRSLPH